MRSAPPPGMPHFGKESDTLMGCLFFPAAMGDMRDVPPVIQHNVSYLICFVLYYNHEIRIPDVASEH
jgi:hypothetical protein